MLSTLHTRTRPLTRGGGSVSSYKGGGSILSYYEGRIHRGFREHTNNPKMGRENVIFCSKQGNKNISYILLKDAS